MFRARTLTTIKKTGDTGITATGLLTEKLKPELWHEGLLYQLCVVCIAFVAGWLVHTSLDGKRDVEPLDNALAYLFASTQHVSGGFPLRTSIGQQRDNRDGRQMGHARAADGSGPLGFQMRYRASRHSQFPRIGDGYGGVGGKREVSEDSRGQLFLDHRFSKAYRSGLWSAIPDHGIVTQEPSKIGPAFGMLVPAVDKDGRHRAGIRLLELAVPLGSYAVFERGQRHVGSDLT